MASPQKENGFTGISNEILEALCRSKMTGRELRVVLYIIRCTYGFGRKEVSLSLQEIATATSMKRQHAHRIISNLSSYRVTAVTSEGDRRKQTFKFNKNYDEWIEKPAKKTVTPEGDRSVTPEGDRKTVLPIIEKKKEIYVKNKSFHRWKFKIKTPIPTDFELTQDMINYAASKNYGADLENFTEQFIANCLSTGRKYSNWYSAWQNWLLNDIKWHPERVKNTGDAVMPRRYEKKYAD